MAMLLVEVVTKKNCLHATGGQNGRALLHGGPDDTLPLHFMLLCSWVFTHSHGVEREGIFQVRM